MKKALISSAAFAALLGLAVPAHAEGDDTVKLELGGLFIGAVSVAENEGADLEDALRDPESYRFDGESAVRFEAVSRFDNGLRYGFKAEVTVDHDIAQANKTKGEKELFDEAFLFLDGGFGRVELGQQEGVADQFSVRSPHALGNMSLSAGRNDRVINPVGMASIGTVNDSSDDYAKVTYMTPSLSGFKLGMSFTPEAQKKTDISAELTEKTVQPEAKEGIVEFGVIYSKSFEDVSLDMSATYLSADSAPVTGNLKSELKEWNAGVNVGFRGLSVGGSYRESGTADSSLQKFEAYDIGVAYETGSWKVSAQYAEHAGELAGAPVEDGYRYLISARYKVAKGIRIGAGFQRDTDMLSAEEGSAFILESALKF